MKVTFHNNKKSKTGIQKCLPLKASLYHGELQKSGRIWSPLLALHPNAVKALPKSEIEYSEKHRNFWTILVIQHTYLKNCFTSSWWLARSTVVLEGDCPAVLSTKLTLVMKPVPNLDFNLIDVPMHRSLPLAIIPMRSLRMSASSIECVVRIMEQPFFAFCIISQTCLLDIGSIPVVCRLLIEINKYARTIRSNMHVQFKIFHSSYWFIKNDQLGIPNKGYCNTEPAPHSSTITPGSDFSCLSESYLC